MEDKEIEKSSELGLIPNLIQVGHRVRKLSSSDNEVDAVQPPNKTPRHCNGVATYGSTSNGDSKTCHKSASHSNSKNLRLPIPLLTENGTTLGERDSCDDSVSEIPSSPGPTSNRSNKISKLTKRFFSEDDSLPSMRSRMHSSGRRSAPIFSLRTFGSTSIVASREKLNVRSYESEGGLQHYVNNNVVRHQQKLSSKKNDLNSRVDGDRSKTDHLYTPNDNSKKGYWSECDVEKYVYRNGKSYTPLSGLDTDETRTKDSENEFIHSPACRCFTSDPNSGRTLDLFRKDTDDDNSGCNCRTYVSKPNYPELVSGSNKIIIDTEFPPKHDEDDEKQPLLPATLPLSKAPRPSAYTKTAVYKKRWYLLLVFSLFSFIYNAVWSTWGPIAQSAKAVFSWTDENIAMFTWVGTIPIIIFMFPLAYLMDVKGMKISMVLCCGLTFVGTGLRCLSSSPDAATWLNYAGQFLNGAAGIVPMSAAALLSGLWFPANQRATATGIATISGYLGSCFSFIVGPLAVPAPPASLPINTSIYGLHEMIGNGNGTNNTSDDVDVLRNGIMNILYYECGAAGLIFLLVLLYFPSKPVIPPSISASLPRENYIDGLKMLVRNKQFWLTSIAFGLPIGVYEVWQVVLDVILNPMVSQETAGWLDFYGTLGGCTVGLLVSRFADLFTRQIKFFLIVFYVIASIALLWFTLMVHNVLPFDIVSVYIACIIIGVCLDGSAPLFFELVIEVSYPAGEGVTSGLLQMMVASAGTAFLSLLQIEALGKSWMNWCFLGCCSLSVPILMMIEKSFVRADLDDLEESLDRQEESKS